MKKKIIDLLGPSIEAVVREVGHELAYKIAGSIYEDPEFLASLTYQFAGMGRDVLVAVTSNDDEERERQLAIIRGILATGTPRGDVVFPKGRDGNDSDDVDDYKREMVILHAREQGFASRVVMLEGELKKVRAVREGKAWPNVDIAPVEPGRDPERRPESTTAEYIAQLRLKLASAAEVIQWMSGSADFAPEGKAGTHWTAWAAPILHDIVNVSNTWDRPIAMIPIALVRDLFPHRDDPDVIPYVNDRVHYAPSRGWVGLDPTPRPSTGNEVIDGWLGQIDQQRFESLSEQHARELSAKAAEVDSVRGEVVATSQKLVDAIAAVDRAHEAVHELDRILSEVVPRDTAPHGRSPRARGRRTRTR